MLTKEIPFLFDQQGVRHKMFIILTISVSFRLSLLKHFDAWVDSPLEFIEVLFFPSVFLYLLFLFSLTKTKHNTFTSSITI